MAETRNRSELIKRWKPIAGVLALVVLANVLLHVFVIRENVRISGDREAILANERKELSQLDDEVMALERTVSKVACARSDERHVFDELISGKATRMTAVLRELHQLADELKVEPGRLSFTRTLGRKSELVRFSASLAFEAPYEVLHEYIERIEKSPNFLFIEQVGLTGPRDKGEDLRLQLRVATWFQGPDLARLDATAGLAGDRP